MSSPRRVSGESLFSLIAYLVITLLYTLPLPLRLSTHIPGDNGDSITNLWSFWYFPHALATGMENLFHPVLQFYPDGIAMVYTSSSFIGAILMAPLSLAINPTAALNVWLLLHIWLGGWMFFRFCRIAGAGRVGAFLGGFAYMCSPFVTVHLPGHYTLVQIGFTAAALYSFAVLARRSSVADAVQRGWVFPAIGLGLATWAVTATDFYLAMMTLLILLPGAFLHFALWYGRQMLGSSRFWKGLGLGVGITVLLLLPIFYFVMQAREGHDYEALDPLLGTILAARWSRLVSLPQYHPLWGPLIYMENPNRVSVFNEYAYIGVVALFIAFVGMLRVSDWRRVVVWIFAFLLALGFSGGNRFTPEPAWQSGPLAFGKYWPAVFPFSEFRVPSRWQFAIVATLAICLAFGVDALVATMRRRSRLAVGAALFALMAFDLVRYPLPTFEARPVKSGLDRVAAAAPGTVLDVPVGIKSGQGHGAGDWAQEALLRQMSHGMPILSTYVSRLPTDVVEKRKSDTELTAFFELQSNIDGTTVSAETDWPALRQRYNITAVRIPDDHYTSESLIQASKQMGVEWNWLHDQDSTIGIMKK